MFGHRWCMTLLACTLLAKSCSLACYHGPCARRCTVFNPAPHHTLLYTHGCVVVYPGIARRLPEQKLQITTNCSRRLQITWKITSSLCFKVHTSIQGNDVQVRPNTNRDLNHCRLSTPRSPFQKHDFCGLPLISIIACTLCSGDPWVQLAKQTFKRSQVTAYGQSRLITEKLMKWSLKKGQTVKLRSPPWWVQPI